MNFETPEELLDFVLVKSGAMKYELFNTTLVIMEGFDIMRVYIAITLIEEHFNTVLDYIIITDVIDEIKEGFLDKTKIKTVEIIYPIKLPELPDTFEAFETHDPLLAFRIKEHTENVQTKEITEYKLQSYIFNDSYWNTISHGTKREMIEKLRESVLLYV